MCCLLMLVLRLTRPNTGATMKLVIIGSLATLYCAVWLARGLTKQSIPDNLMKIIEHTDEKYRVMIGAYGVGTAISLAVLIMGFTSL